MYPRIFQIPLPFEIAGLEEITVYSYGFMVVVAVLTAAWLAGKELDRLYREGRVGSIRIPLDNDRKGRTRTQEVSPSHMVWTLATLAAVTGFIGARILFILERPAVFARNPLGMIFASGGFTFYGGLILAAIVIIWYIRRQDLSVKPFADAFAPGLMIGYGIGRIGCYLAGDGDWGLCSDLAAKPAFLPDWLWSEDFANSILGAPATVLQDCPTWAEGVYPTMLYEFTAAVILGGILWALRKHPYQTGWLFSLYLVFNGIERFFIEMIRVTREYEIFGLHPTEAQVIALFLFAAGIAGLIYFSKRRDRAEAEPPVEEKASATA